MINPSFYQEKGYKPAIRAALRGYNELRKSRRLSFRKIAAAAGIQHTYLSRVLNQEGAHLSEDQLYSLAGQLQLTDDETEFLFLLRAAEATRIVSRREKIERQIAKLRKAYSLRAKPKEFQLAQFQRDIDHLLDPFCVLIHTALDVPAYGSNPRALCRVFGISEERLRTCLRVLTALDYLVFDPDTLSVRELKPIHQHISKDHPLVRSHHQLIRTLAATQVLKLDDSDKRFMQVTFAADPDTVARIGNRFFEFLAEIEPEVVKAPSQGVYQLMFDLFRWG